MKLANFFPALLVVSHCPNFVAFNVSFEPKSFIVSVKIFEELFVMPLTTLLSILPAKAFIILVAKPTVAEPSGVISPAFGSPLSLERLSTSEAIWLLIFNSSLSNFSSLKFPLAIFFTEVKIESIFDSASKPALIIVLLGESSLILSPFLSTLGVPSLFSWYFVISPKIFPINRTTSIELLETCSAALFISLSSEV